MHKLTILLHSQIGLLTKQTNYKAAHSPTFQHKVAFQGNPMQGPQESRKQSNASNRQASIATASALMAIF